MTAMKGLPLPISRSILVIFTLPTLMMGFMHGPEAIVQGIYAKYSGLALTALATAVLLTRLFDAVTYPLIGYLSDQTFARTGSRRGWILAGVAISVVGMWFLYRPPANVSIIYYGVWSAVTYLGWKTTEIPYMAWSFGLTRDYDQRSRIQAWRMMAMLIGQMLFFATPVLAKALGMSDSNEVNLGALSVTAVMCAILLPLSTLWAVFKVPAGEAAMDAPRSTQLVRVYESLRAIGRNKPLLQFLAAFAPVSFLGGMAAGVSFLFIDSFLKLSDSFALISALGLLLTLGGVPFWGWLSMRYERHRVWAASLIACAVAYTGMAFAPPGDAAYLPALIFFPLATLCLVGTYVAITMVGDIVDYGSLQTGEDLSGTYAAILAFMQKSAMSVAGAAGLAVVGWFGFDATAAIQTERGAFGIRFVAVIIPAVGVALAAMIIWSFPLTRKKMEEVRAELAARNSGIRS